MARFDVYKRPDGAGYLLDAQADILDGLTTRVVVPLLLTEQAPRPAQRLNPVFSIEGVDYVMVTQFLAAIDITDLNEKPTSNLQQHHVEIMDALDMVFVGF